MAGTEGSGRDYRRAAKVIQLLKEMQLYCVTIDTVVILFYCVSRSYPPGKLSSGHLDSPCLVRNCRRVYTYLKVKNKKLKNKRRKVRNFLFLAEHFHLKTKNVPYPNSGRR